MRIQASLLLSIILLSGLQAIAQETNIAAPLSMEISPERAWWDLQHYTLKVHVDPDSKSIAGSNQVRFKVVSAGTHKMQIDLQEPMQIDSIRYADKTLVFERDQAAHYISFPPETVFKKNQIDSLKIYFSGSPIQAKNAPWDGGIVWEKDSLGNAFAASAVQGIGASTWWPTKEHNYDKPDEGVDLYYTTHKDYSIIGNGKLVNIKDAGEDLHTWHWQVKNPISNYNISFNLGKYAVIQDSYEGLNGKLDLTFYPLAADKEKAEKHFAQVKDMLEAMEFWFGPYPFYEDGYKLTQAPFVGMEHQSNVAWGNGFQQGYTGNDMTQTGYGMTFDFMIVHESIHEWFGNSFSYTDIADMWLHESFTTYGEALYVEYFHGKEAGQAYTKGTRWRIQNQVPIQGEYGVGSKPGIDIYFKGANMLLTLRQIIDDDTIWREILQHLQSKYRHKVVTSQAVEQEIATMANRDLKSFFDVYLRQAQPPTLEWKVENNQLHFRYTEVPDDFTMPLRLYIAQDPMWIYPTTEWQNSTINPNQEIHVDSNFYIKVKAATESE